jgi:hypothetical protein
MKTFFGFRTELEEAKLNELSPELLHRAADKADKKTARIGAVASKQDARGKDSSRADTMYRASKARSDRLRKGAATAADRDAEREYQKQKAQKHEAMSPAQKAAHDKAVAAFKARGGKVTKLAPGKAAGWHGKDDFGTGQKGMLGKSDTSKFGTKKRVKSMQASMQAHVENTELDEKVYSKPAKLDPAIARDPKVKAAQKSHAKGDWDGNVDKEGNAVVHVKGKPHTVTVQMESMNEATNMFTDDRVGFQIDRFAMGQGKVGFQINYGKGRGKYIQVPMDDMKRVIAQMTKAMKAKI